MLVNFMGVLAVVCLVWWGYHYYFLLFFFSLLWMVDEGGIYIWQKWNGTQRTEWIFTNMKKKTDKFAWERKRKNTGISSGRIWIASSTLSRIGAFAIISSSDGALSLYLSLSFWGMMRWIRVTFLCSCCCHLCDILCIYFSLLAFIRFHDNT